MSKNTKDKYRIIKTAITQITKIVFLLSLILSGGACVNKTNNQTLVEEYVYIQYENGIPKEIGILQDSVKQGLWIRFYPTGKADYISFYKDGKQTGPQRRFYENGRLASYHEMLQDLNHGKYTTYYNPNGRIASESYWINDTINGISTQYLENGEIDTQVEYKKGKCVRVIIGVLPIIEE